MISHKYKCIFVEVPKTATSSIRAVLGMPLKPHLNIWQIKYELETCWTRYGGGFNRLLASLYLLLSPKSRERIGQERFRSYFKFGFVRNPWDRVVSLYERREGLQMRDKMSFEAFVEWLNFSSSTCIHPSPHRNQLDWFVDPHGEVIVDFIGRFETLTRDWARIAGRLGIRQPLPHKNRNPRERRPYPEYYTSRTRELVARKFRVDIDFFGYEFDHSPSAPAYESLCACYR